MSTIPSHLLLLVWLILQYNNLLLATTQVDIKLSEDMRLREAHTIGESLQEKIEKLPEVERAFVHIDFESTHKPEHKVRSRLPATDT